MATQTEVTTASGEVITLVLQVEPAPADSGRIARLESYFWIFFVILIGVWGWMTVRRMLEGNPSES